MGPLEWMIILMSVVQRPFTKFHMDWAVSGEVVTTSMTSTGQLIGASAVVGWDEGAGDGSIVGFDELANILNPKISNSKKGQNGTIQTKVEGIRGSLFSLQ